MNRPPSDHFDGKRFFNPGDAPARRGLPQVLRWRLTGDRARWPASVAPEVHLPPPATVAPGQVAVSFVNHSTFLLRFAGATVLTDPVWSERCSPLAWLGPKRVRPPGLPLETLPRINLVLLSHNHYDHMDLRTLRTLRAHDPEVVTTSGNGGKLRRLGLRVVELDWWEATEAAGLRITATPARHFSRRTPFDQNRSLWGGFFLNGVLFAGDSGAGPHWAAIRTRLGAPDLALLPVGAYEPRWLMGPVHMNPAEAVQAHLDLGARHSVGMHFGTFQLTDEAIEAPEEALRRAAERLDPRAFVMLGFGETRLFSLGGAS